MHFRKKLALLMLTGITALSLTGCPQKVTATAPAPPPSLPAPDRKPMAVPPGVMAGNLLHPVPPHYPAEAKAKGISGTVRLRGIITKTGDMTQLTVISSPDPALTDAAIAAVYQWKYKPYTLMGSPVDVDTTITVNFTLDKKK